MSNVQTDVIQLYKYIVTFDITEAWFLFHYSGPQNCFCMKYYDHNDITFCSNFSIVFQNPKNELSEKPELQCIL